MYSRRRVLSAMGSLFGIGAGAWLITSSSRRDSPGAEGLSIGTVPAESDPLLLIDPVRTRRCPADSTFATALLGYPAFEAVRPFLSGVFDDGSTGGTSENLGKLAVVGSSAGNGSAAVAWADWSDDDLEAIVTSSTEGSIETGMDDGQTVYRVGEKAATRLGNRVFTIGSTDVVRSVVEVWHGDVDPITGPVLRSFEYSDKDAPVRFGTTGRGFANATTTPRSQVYESIATTSADIICEDSEAALEVAYRADSSDLADPIAEELERDLGLVSNADPVEFPLPRMVYEDLTIQSDMDYVNVEFRASIETVETFTADFLATLGTVTGGK